MPEHVVEQGECLSSIGARHGFSWKALWDHSRNGELKRRRKDPNVLYPGDVVFIPEKTLKEEGCPVDSKHRFCKLHNLVKLKLRLLDEDKPRSGLAYRLLVDSQVFTGETNASGELEHLIPAGATFAQLILERDAYSLEIGALDPVAEISGVQKRLFNLGFTAKEADGVLDEETRGALRAFQEKHALDPTGEVDQATQDKLVQIHGS